MSGGEGLTWGAVQWLNLLWGLPVLGLLLLWAQRRRRGDLERMAAAPVLARLVAPDLGERRAWQSALLLVGVALLIVALAQPQIGFQWRDLERHGIDLALVVDVSRSMDAEDVGPSRMERARREIIDLCEQAPGDRMGLVVFAAGAYPRVPLTLDHQALLTILREVDTGTLKAQGSSLPAAIREALRLLQDSEQNDKAIVLISDGEIPDAERAIAAARVAGEADVSIYAMGVGTPEGAPIPLASGGFKKRPGGEVVITKLDETSLRRIAATAGGAYVRSVASEDDVEALVDEIHDDTEGALLGVHRERVPNEHFQWPLGAGLVFIALGLVLGLPRRAFGAAAAAGLALLIVLPGAARAGALDEGLEALEQGAFEQAADLLMEHHTTHPDDMDAALILGKTLLLSGRPNEAERVWEQVAERSTDNKERAMARYDMGHAAYQGGRLTQAVEHFRRAAEIDPELEAASKNAEAVAREIAARTQDPEQQPNENCDNPQEGDQDQQDQENQDQQDQQDQENQDQQDQDEQDQDQDQQDQENQDQQNQDEQQQDQQDDGTRQEQPEPQDPMQGEIEPADGEQQPAGDPAQQQSVPLTPEELERARALERLDEVEEGSPRVVIPGDESEDQDW